MIITVTLNPAVDKTVVIDTLVVNGLNRLENVISNAGGKGINVSKTLKNLNVDSLATGFIAGSNGQYITSVLDEYNIRHDFCKVSGNTRVNLKVLDKEMNLTELNEVGTNIEEGELNNFVSKLHGLVNVNDVVVLSGSVPKGVSADIYAKLIKLCKCKGAKVILDADKDLFKNGVKENPTLIKPNKYELCQYFNISEETTDIEIVNKTKDFIKDGIEYVAISLGSKGAYFLNKDKVYYAEGLKIEAHSSVGAGDAMVAALTYCINENIEFEEMIKLAVATSAGAVETIGTNPAKLERIKELEKLVKVKELL